MLELRNVVVRFGGLVAVNGVSLDVQAGEIHALIGPNGAGKSTIINVVTGLYTPSEGDCVFQNESVCGKPTHLIARSGLTRTFQNTELFADFSVIENVMVGLDHEYRYGIVSRLLNLPKWRRNEAAARHEALELLKKLKIEQFAEQKAGTLPFGLRRRLEIARALATRPKLLLLDEPAAGLRHHEIIELNQILEGLRDDLGLAILLVDHVMKVVMAISNRVTVLNFGRHVATGSVSEIKNNPDVIAAYLGGASGHA
jgi:branched-chain amino acid transport system ATP-binding protein